MTSQSDGAVDVATEAAPEAGAAEQPKQTQSFEDQLIQLAREDGLIGGPAKAEDSPPAEEPKAQDEPAETTPGETTELPETPAEGEESDEETQEPKPAAKGEPWPESARVRVAEETEKRKRANDRADRTEQQLQEVRAQLVQTQQQLAASSGPVPTPDNPLIDVQEPVVLDKLERVYEALEEVDIDRVNEDGTVTVPAAIGRDGNLVYQKIDPEQARLAQKRADRVLRKDIPMRRRYLAERAQVDASAAQLYPDLNNPDNEFTKAVNHLTNQVLSGQAMNSPEVRFWVANALFGLVTRTKEAQAANGKGPEASLKKIVAASKQKLAPTASRTRSFVEQRSSADLAKTTKEFEKNPTLENATAYVGAIRSRTASQKTVQPVAE